MTFRDTFGLALRNLNQAKLRTALTTLGVSIGIASLAGMMSLGVGLEISPLLHASGLFDAITVARQAPRSLDEPEAAASVLGRARGAKNRNGRPGRCRHRDAGGASAARSIRTFACRSGRRSIRVDFAMASGTPASARKSAFQSMTAGVLSGRRSDVLTADF